MLTEVDKKEENTDKPAHNPALEALFEVGAHIGYSKSHRHPKMQEFIFCTRNDIEILNLEKTEEKLNQAEDYLRSLGKAGQNVIWVGTKAAAKAHISEAGIKLKHPFVSERWLGGTFTNFSILEERMAYLEKLEKEFESGEFKKYVKKERMAKSAELTKLKRVFEGLRPLKSIPKAALIIDPKEEKTAFSEARKKGLDIIAVLSSDCNPEGIKYPIPANDNSSGVIALITNRLVKAYEEGAKAKTTAEDVVPKETEK